MSPNKKRKKKVRIVQMREPVRRKPAASATLVKWFQKQNFAMPVGVLATIVISAAALSYGTSFINQPADTIAEVAPEHQDVPTVVAQAPVIVEEEPLFPQKQQLKVGKGDTLIELLTDTGVSHSEAFEAVSAIRKIYDPRKINSGQEFNVTLDESEAGPEIPSLSQLTMPISGMTTIELHKLEDGEFVVKKVDVPVTAHPHYSKLDIEGSLYVTARRAGLTPKLIMELMKGFAFDVDFQRDIQRGHQLEIVVDTLKDEEGRVVGARNLRFAKLTMGRKKVEVYRYTDSKGNEDYYNAKGESLKKYLLRTPVDGARISSRYGMRKHPILGYNKMHKGVDFAAPTGTPIYAAGDGVVDYKGRRGAYGHYVRIKHNKKYSTAYAHISRYAKGLRKGKRVRQGQIIAYVGSTGRSTGPHLHYEVLKYGKQTNPAKIQQFNSGPKLAGKELKSFKSLMAEVESVIASTENSLTVASAAQ